jgi:hypothetical protein
MQDVLVTTKSIKVQDDDAMKVMLTRIAMTFDGVAESGASYSAEVDYDYEHRYAEHEHESQTDETPDLSDLSEAP